MQNQTYDPNGPRLTEIVIEIDDETVYTPEDRRPLWEKQPPDFVRSGNCAHYFFPIGKTLRSRFVPDRVGPGKPPALLTIDSIPGQRIHIDIENRIGRITDALGDKKNEILFERIKRAAVNTEIFGDIGQPVQPQEVELYSDQLLWTWLYHMRRLLIGHKEGRFCVPVQNVDKLPSLEEIVASGKVEIPIFDDAVKSKVKEDFLTPQTSIIKDRSAVGV